jgi:hypothetical protein
MSSKDYAGSDEDDSCSACQKRCLMCAACLLTLPCLPCVYVCRKAKALSKRRKEKKRSKLPVADIQDDEFLSHKDESDDSEADDYDNQKSMASWRATSSKSLGLHGGSRHDNARYTASTPPHNLQHGQNSDKGRVVHIHQAYNPIPHPPLSSAASSPVCAATSTKPVMAW